MVGIALNPILIEAYVKQGKVYLHIGLLDKAIDANTQALNLASGRGRLNRNR